MFKVDDYVIYNSTGVYKIIDIVKDKNIDNNEIEYYVLQPAFNNNMTVKTPVNNPKVSMRTVISKDEVLSLIESMHETEAVWIEDKRERSADFKTALKSGDTEEWARLIKTLYLEQQEKSEQGKKLWKADEDILKSARKNLEDEFAVALNISPEEVPDFIKAHASK